MASTQLAKIITKMELSCSEDVQKWAVKNLISKISCGLVQLDELCAQFPDIAVKLLLWLSNQKLIHNNEIYEQALNLLHKLSTDSIAKLCLKEQVHTICKLREFLINNNYSTEIIDLVLKNVMDGQQQMPMSTQIIQQQPQSQQYKQLQQSIDQIPIQVKPQKDNQEYIQLPLIRLTESDEKVIFDTVVTIKFGNNSTVLNTIRNILPNILEDFPTEVLRQKHELVSELVLLSNSTKEDNLIYYSLKSLELIIVKFIERLQMCSTQSNYHKDEKIYQKDVRDYISNSYPSLEPRSLNEFSNIEQLNHKSIKEIIEQIGVGVLSNYKQFIGLRIRIVIKIIELLQIILMKNEKAAIDSIFQIITQITKLFDINDNSLQDQDYIPLYIISEQIVNILPEQTDLTQWERFTQYLSQAQFSFIYTQERSRQVIKRITTMNSQISSKTQVIDDIMASLKVYWTSQQINQELIILKLEDMEQAVKLYQQLLLAIPLAENLLFIKNYVQLYLYQYSGLFDTTNLKATIKENFKQVLYSQSSTAKQIIFNQILQNLSIQNQLKVAKGMQIRKSIQQLQIEMLGDEQLIMELFKCSRNEKELYKTLLDILIEVLKQNPYFELSFCVQLIISNQQLFDKKTQQLLSLMGNQDSNAQILQLQMDLFSRTSDKRKQAAKLLLQFSQLPNKPSEIDFMEDILDKQSSEVIYSDSLDEKLHKKNEKQQISVSIEQLSNLENIIMSKSNDIKLKCSAIQQITDILVQFQYFEKEVLRSAQVKIDSMKSYLHYVIENMVKLLKDLYQQVQKETSTSRMNGHFLQIGSLLELLGVCQQLKDFDMIECALYTLGVANDKQQRYQAFRYIYQYLFQDQLINKQSYYTLPTIQQQIQDNQNYWRQYYPLQSNTQIYLIQYMQFLQSNTSFECYQQKIFHINKGNQFIQSLDLYLTYEQLKLECSIDQSIFEELKTTMMSPNFLGTELTYVLNLISNYEKTKPYWVGLLNSVHQLFLENTGQEQVEYLYLYIQLLSVVRQQSDATQYIVKYLPKHQFNLRTATYILKLLKYNLIDANPVLIQYLQRNILQSIHKLTYENTSLVIKLLKLSRNIDIFQELEQIDQQILFSRLLQLTQSHINYIRFQSLNILSRNITRLEQDQLTRLAEQSVDSFFQINESEQNYPMLITVIIKLLPLPLLTRLISFIHQQIRMDIGQLSKAGLLKLLYVYTIEVKEEAIKQIINLGIEKLCCKFITEVKDDHSLLVSLHSTMIISMLMRQSVSKSLQLVQSLNVIEILVHCIHSLRKLTQCNSAILSSCLCEISLLFQFMYHYHKDYLQIELRRVTEMKPKWDTFASITMGLQHAEFNLNDKVGISKILLCLLDCEIMHPKLNDDIILSVVSIYRELSNQSNYDDTNVLDIIQILSVMVNCSSQAKLVICRSDVSIQITGCLNKELESIIYEPNKKKQSQNNNKSMSINNMSMTFQDPNQIVQSQSLRVYCIFIKLLFRSNQQQIEFDDSINEVISITLNIAQKLLQIAQRTNNQQVFEYFYTILVNMSTNDNFITKVTQKLGEQKWQLLQEIQKYVKLDFSNTSQFHIQMYKLLAVMGQNADIRLVYVRNKAIEESIEKIVNNWENKKKWQPNSPINQAIINFLASLTFFKDSQSKILPNTQLLNILMEILSEQPIDSPLCSDIMLILNNCALNNKLKKTILGNIKFAPTILTILTNSNNQPDNRYKASQILINLLYKCTSAVSFFNKPQVLEEIDYTMKESQRQMDKLIIQMNELNLITQKEIQMCKVKQLQNLSNNLNQIKKILGIEW